MASAHGFSSLEFVLFSVASCQDGFCSFCYGAESLPPMYYYTVVKHSYFTFLLKKKKFYTFLGTWSGFALPRRQFPVLISLKVWIFFDLLRFFGVLWLIFFFLFCHYFTLQSTKATQIGLGLPSTSQLSPSLHLDNCGEGILKGIVCLVLVSHLCNWLKV